MFVSELRSSPACFTWPAHDSKTYLSSITMKECSLIPAGIQNNSPKSWDTGSKVNKNRVLWSFTGTETNHRGKWNVVQSHSGAFLSCQRSRVNIIYRRADTLSQTPAASLAWPVNLTPCMALDCWRKYPIKCVILRTICAHLELMSATRLYEVGPCFLFSFNNSP